MRWQAPPSLAEIDSETKGAVHVKDFKGKLRPEALDCLTKALSERDCNAIHALDAFSPQPVGKFPRARLVDTHVRANTHRHSYSNPHTHTCMHAYPSNACRVSEVGCHSVAVFFVGKPTYRLQQIEVRWLQRLVLPEADDAELVVARHKNPSSTRQLHLIWVEPALWLFIVVLDDNALGPVQRTQVTVDFRVLGVAKVACRRCGLDVQESLCRVVSLVFRHRWAPDR